MNGTCNYFSASESYFFCYKMATLLHRSTFDIEVTKTFKSKTMISQYISVLTSTNVSTSYFSCFPFDLDVILSGVSECEHNSLKTFNYASTFKLL